MISHLTANQQIGKRGNPTLKNKGKNNKSRTEEQLEQHHSHTCSTETCMVVDRTHNIQI